jgi:hypothetical protein
LEFTHIEEFSLEEVTTNDHTPRKVPTNEYAHIEGTTSEHIPPEIILNSSIPVECISVEYPPAEYTATDCDDTIELQYGLTEATTGELQYGLTRCASVESVPGECSQGEATRREHTQTDYEPAQCSTVEYMPIDDTSIEYIQDADPTPAVATVKYLHADCAPMNCNPIKYEATKFTPLKSISTESTTTVNVLTDCKKPEVMTTEECPEKQFEKTAICDSTRLTKLENEGAEQTVIRVEQVECSSEDIASIEERPVRRAGELQEATEGTTVGFTQVESTSVAHDPTRVSSLVVDHHHSSQALVQDSKETADLTARVMVNINMCHFVIGYF